MDKFIELLRAKGYKITPQRRAVIAALFAGEKFSSAQRILAVVKEQMPDVGLDTIYRNLNLLVALEMVNEIKTGMAAGNLFEPVVEHEHHHHHFICLKCGAVECIDFCPVRESDLHILEAQGLTVVTHSLEIYGYCRNCGQ